MEKFKEKADWKLHQMADFVADNIVANTYYYIAVDLTDGRIVFMTHKSKSDKYHFIGHIPKNNDTSMNTARVIKQAHKEYKMDAYICKTTAIKEYGRKNVTDKAYITEVDNPYYKCSAPMVIYDRNVIEYYMKH